MAGKNSRTTVISPLPRGGTPALTGQDGPPALDILPAEDLDNTLAKVMLELGEDDTDANVQIWRIVKDTRKPSYVTTFAPSEFTLERLKATYGGGTYNIRVNVPHFENGERKGSRLAACPYIVIDGEPITPKPPAVVETVPSAPAPSELSLILKTIADGQQAMIQAITQRPPEKSLIEQFKDLAEVKKLLNGDAPAPVKNDPLADLERLANLREKMQIIFPSGDGGDSSMWLKMGSDLIRAIAAKAGEPVPAAPLAQVTDQTSDAGDTVAGGAVEQVKPAANVSEEDMAMRFVYQGYVKMLVLKARRNEDVNAIAEDAYPMLAGEDTAWLFKSEDWLAKLAEFDAEVKTHTVWFTRLRDALKAIHERETKAG